MAYDEGLAQRIRDALSEARGVEEKKMFGGLAFMVNGHMALGVVKEDLMVRVGSENHDEAMKEPHTRPMDFTGKRMRGMLFVAAEGLDDDDLLRGWVRWASGYALSQPPKEKGTRPKKAAKSPSKEAPVKEPPKKKAPVKEPPKKRAPVKEPPKKRAPVKEPPKKKAPVKEPPKKEAPVKEPPKKKAQKKSAKKSAKKVMAR